MTDQAVTTFQQGLHGRLVQPADTDYHAIRALYNGMIDKRPRLIARVADAADVITAVNFAREQGLLLAIRGGGHSGPGLGSCNDGLMIDLSLLKSVRVDPAAKTVRVEPGCNAGDVDHATHAFGLAVPFGIVANTGVAGLTLGGGTGYLTRKYGLTIDSLLEVDVVLADGSFVTASAHAASGSVLGGARRRRQLRRDHQLPVQGAPGQDGLRRPDLLGCRQGRTGRDARLSRVPADRAGGTGRVRRLEDRAVDRSVPEGALGQTRVRRHLRATTARSGRREGDGAARQETAHTAFQLDGHDAAAARSTPCSIRSSRRGCSGTGRATS